MLLGNIRYRKLFGLLSLLIVVSGPVNAQGEEMTGTTETGRNSDSATTASTPLDHALFALKTNALFDAVLGFNGEIEVPIGRDSRWSVMAEFWKPWWVWRNNSRAAQLQVIGGEVRYWWGKDRSERRELTGWFGGLYYANGKYDFEWSSKGDQGEFNSVGATVGYSMPIHRRWNLELSASVGHLWGPRRHYEATEDGSHLLWKYTTTSKYTGPTKIKVSFVWLLGHRKRNQQKGGPTL